MPPPYAERAPQAAFANAQRIPYPSTMVKRDAPAVEVCSLVAGLPDGSEPVVIAVLIFDAAGDRLWMRFRPDLNKVIAEEHLDVVLGTEDHFHQLVQEDGATSVMAWMKDTLSGFIRLNGPTTMARPRNWQRALNDVYANALGEAAQGHSSSR